MTIEQRLKLIRSVGEEIITEEDLVSLLEAKSTFKTYDGFEPSGRIHIAQGILRATNVNRMIEAGAEFNMLIADWHAWANNKLGGDLEKIQTTGDYLVEVWRLTGMNLSRVNFLWVSDFVKDDAYWKMVMRIARNSTLKRILRTSQIMGRSESEVLQASHILYPCMQCADVFWQDLDATQLGMDQRKVNMLAREVGPKLFGKKPVVISHHMLLGLVPPKNHYDNLEKKIMDLKMSKSNPDSAIFMTDTESEISRKIVKAYCPEGLVDGNPILEYAKYLVFEVGKKFVVERSSKFGGDIVFSTFTELSKVFRDKELHPLDLKKAIVRELNNLVEPVRKAFDTNNRLRDLKDLVESFEVTR
ncbi:MAG: tyrosine--tRNA ligase [Candidatus Heimdallarchaeota archaeon]